jgi:hypothetical protein
MSGITGCLHVSELAHHSLSSPFTHQYGLMSLPPEKHKPCGCPCCNSPFLLVAFVFSHSNLPFSRCHFELSLLLLAGIMVGYGCGILTSNFGHGYLAGSSRLGVWRAPFIVEGVLVSQA